MDNLGNLYIVATPIGNMSDISFRAVEILKNSKYIACEDTRKTGLLLKKLDIRSDQKLISFYEGVEGAKQENIINVLTNGVDVALVSDSGTPTISDPGFKLVRVCLDRGIKVVSIPGPSALITALSASGLPTDKFLFLGFLPKKEGNKMRLLSETKEAILKVSSTVIIYEAPHRLIKTLISLEIVFGDIEIILMRELTKIYEERRSSKISKFIKEYNKKVPRGEFVILFNIKIK